MNSVLNILKSLSGGLRKHLGINGFLAMAAGVVVGNFIQLEALRYVIPAALFLMLYPSMLDVRPKTLAAVLTQPKLPLIALAMNFVLSPLLLAGINHLFQLHDNPSLLTGITLYGTIPCGGMIAAFTAHPARKRGLDRSHNHIELPVKPVDGSPVDRTPHRKDRSRITAADHQTSFYNHRNSLDYGGPHQEAGLEKERRRRISQGQK